MNEKKLNPDNIYCVYGLAKEQLQDDTEDQFDLLLNDKHVIYIEELGSIYKIIFEFKDTREYQRKSQEYLEQNISIGIPTDKKISYIDRVVEYIEADYPKQGKFVQIIKDIYFIKTQQPWKHPTLLVEENKHHKYGEEKN